MTTTTLKAPTRSAPSKNVLIAGAVIVALVVAAIIGALAFGGGDDEVAAAETSSVTRIPSGSEVRQVSFAAIDGPDLPELDTTLAVDPAIGMAAPSITASYFDNSEATISFGDGEPAIVLFLAHWCPHCQDEVISLSPWFEANGVPSDVRIIAVSTAVDEGSPNYPPSKWLLREEWPTEVVRDSANSDLARGFGLSGFPYLVVIDGDGNIVNRQSGGGPIALWENNLALARS